MNPTATDTSPFQSVSIGLWYLLLDFRIRFCKCVEASLQKNRKQDLRGLLQSSKEDWKRLFGERWFRRRFHDRFGEDRQLEEYTSLLGYLDDCVQLLKTYPDSLLLDRLVFPYIFLRVPDTEELKWWIPPAEFLALQQTGETRTESTDLLTPPLALYPYFKPPLLDFLRVAAGTEQETSDLRSTDPSDWPTLFASAMSSFQTKMIGSYEAIPNPMSRFEDRLVGNASACMRVLRSPNGADLGLLVLTSPVFGLFHELLLTGIALPDQLRGRRDFNYVCCQDLTEDEWRTAAAFESSKDIATGCHQFQVPPDVTDVQDGISFEAVYVLCRRCVAEPDYAEKTCIFKVIDRLAGPTASEFLKGLQGLKTKKEMEAKVRAKAAEVRAQATIDEETIARISAMHAVKDPYSWATDAMYHARRAIDGNDKVLAKAHLDRAAALLGQVVPMYNVIIREFLGKSSSSRHSVSGPSSVCSPIPHRLDKFMDDIKRTYSYVEALFGIHLSVTAESDVNLSSVKLAGQSDALRLACHQLIANAVEKLRSLHNRAQRGQHSIGMKFTVGSIDAQEVCLEIRDSGGLTDADLKAAKAAIEAVRLTGQPCAKQLTGERSIGLGSLGLGTADYLLRKYGGRVDVPHRDGAQAVILVYLPAVVV